MITDIPYYNFDCCSLCQDMREYEAGSSSRRHGAVSHLDELGKRKTIKPDSYFSDEDASD